MRPEVIQQSIASWQSAPEKAKSRPAVVATADGAGRAEHLGLRLISVAGREGGRRHASGRQTAEPSCRSTAPARQPKIGNARPKDRASRRFAGDGFSLICNRRAFRPAIERRES